jgi:heterodisulfide reductase subunit A-like polyferredoxin
MQYENKGRFIVKFKDIPTPRQHQIELEPDVRRQDYREAELGFDEERALKEAKRCLSCRRCLGCALCWAECKPEAIQFDMQDEIFEFEADSVIISPGVERALDRIDKKFGLGKETNVITDLQLERMLSENGPSAGLVIRPYDGEVPKSVAFVQAFDKTSPSLGKAALTFAVNEAALLRQKLPRASISMYTGGVEDFPEAQKAIETSKVDLVKTPVMSVASEENSSVKLTLDGDGGTADFDLVVLITQPQISKDARDLTKNLGLSLTYGDFLAGEAGLIKTDKEPVQLVGQA